VGPRDNIVGKKGTRRNILRGESRYAAKEKPKRNANKCSYTQGAAPKGGKVTKKGGNPQLSEIGQ